MTSWVNHLARQDRQWNVIAKIDGLSYPGVESSVAPVAGGIEVALDTPESPTTEYFQSANQLNYTSAATRLSGHLWFTSGPSGANWPEFGFFGSNSPRACIGHYSNNEITIELRHSGGTFNAYFQAGGKSANTLYHIAWVYDGTQMITVPSNDNSGCFSMWLNGVSLTRNGQTTVVNVSAMSTLAGLNVYAQYNINSGNPASTSSVFHSGAIWLSALSGADVAALYAAGPDVDANGVSATQPTHQWLASDGAFPNIPDSGSAASIDLVAYNMESNDFIAGVAGSTSYYTEGSDPRVRLCSAVPAYATHPELYQDIIGPELPDILGERTELVGGATKQGSISLQLVDVDDYLTDILAVDAGHVAVLSAELSAGGAASASISVNSTAPFAQGDIIHIGSEAMLVDSLDSATAMTVTRGYSGSSNLYHPSGARVYDRPTSIAGRRLYLYVAPIDGDSHADEQLIGEYVIRGVRWDSTTNIWTLDADSQLAYLDRAAPVSPWSVRVASLSTYNPARGLARYNSAAVGSDFGSIDTISVESGYVTSSDLTSLYADGQGEDFYGAIGDSVGTFLVAGSLASLSPIRKDILSSGSMDIKPGDSIRYVLLSEAFESGSSADPAPGGFRYSPGPSPATTRGSSFIRADHWVEILLIIMLSSSSEYDGLELTNYETSGSNFRRSNFSYLPSGYGLGIPSSMIDWDAWEEVWQRTQEFRFDSFVYGLSRENFLEIASREFLKPVGASIVSRNGLISIKLIRTPSLADAPTALAADDVIADSSGVPSLKLSLSSASVYESVVFSLGRGGDKNQLRMRSDDFQGNYGQQGLYVASGPALSIEAESMSGSRREWLSVRAGSLLWWSHRQRFHVEVAVDAERLMLSPGDIVSLTLAELPDLQGAARGWSSVLCVVLSSEPRLSLDSGAIVTLAMAAYPPQLNIGTIAPSARVSSVATNDATVAANAYSQASAAGALPTSDASAFAVGDVVSLYSGTTGARFSGTQTITAIAGNVISLDGNFSGNLASGTIISFAPYASALASQRTSAFYATQSSMLVGSAQPYMLGD